MKQIEIGPNLAQVLVYVAYVVFVLGIVFSLQFCGR